MAFNTTLKHFTSSQELASIWATGENYLLNQLVLENDVIYRCAIAHTSGATFATDLGAGKWVAVSAAGASGSKNYIENGDFEDNNTTGWSLFNTTIDSTTKIPTGSIVAGAAGFNALSVSGSSPLAGSYSLSVSTAAGVTITTTGYGFISDAFTIDREDQAKVMGFSFYYEAVSGTMNFSGTSSNTFAVYIRDVSGGAWIQPAGVYNLVQSSGSGICSGTFQTTATGTQYQVAVLMINTVSAAVSMRFDDFQLGPQKVLAGAAISDWVSFTPTFNNISGFNISPNGVYRRVGDSIEVQVQFRKDASAGVSGSDVQLNLPFPMNTGKTAGGVKESTFGVWGGLHVPTFGQYNSGTIFRGDVSGTFVTFLKPAGASALLGTDFKAGAEFSLVFKYPAAGLSSNTVMSQDTDTRVVAASATQNFAGAAVVTGTTLKWTSNITQTHGTYDSSTGIFTAPVSGFYEVSAIVGWYSSADCQIALSLQKNGSGSDCQFKARNNATNNVCNHLLERLIYLNANDNIRVIITVDAGAATYISASDSSAISIKRLSGPATIAASESVGFKATVTTTSIPSGATQPMVFSNVVYSTHGAYSASTGVFKAPVSGKYQCNGAISVTYVANQDVAGGLSFFKNGVTQSWVGSVKHLVGGDTIIGNVISDIIHLNAGDELDLRCYQTNPSSAARSPFNGIVNYFSVMRVGN